MSLTQNVTTSNTVQISSTASDPVSTVASSVEMSASGISSGLAVTSVAVPRTYAQASNTGADRQLDQVLSAVSYRAKQCCKLAK